jgi:hypothetical protein
LSSQMGDNFRRSVTAKKHLNQAASLSVSLDQLVVGWEALHKENSEIGIVSKWSRTNRASKWIGFI